MNKRTDGFFFNRMDNGRVNTFYSSCNFLKKQINILYQRLDNGYTKIYAKGIKDIAFTQTRSAIKSIGTTLVLVCTNEISDLPKMKSISIVSMKTFNKYH